MQKISAFITLALILSTYTGSVNAKSQGVYLLPSEPGKLGKIIPRTNKASLDWLINYNWDYICYFLGNLLPGDTLGVYFEPPAACSLK